MRRSQRIFFDGVTYPWEVLPKISSFILKLGETLSSEEYEKRGENVWDREVSESRSDGIYQRSCDHRKRCRGAPLCIYPRKRHRR